MQISRRQTLRSLGALLSLPTLSLFNAVTTTYGAATGSTEFLEAVRTGALERVRTMLATDPDLAKSIDGIGRSAFVLAHVAGHRAIADLIAATGIELDIVEAVLAEDWERFEALADAEPALLNHAHPIGGTPLYAAALMGSLDFWRLRSKGCAWDERPEGGSGFTAARGALESVRPEWARIGLTDLCSNGSDVNAAQRGGSTVLHGAVGRRNEMLVKLAIRKGADVNALDAHGRSARTLAAELGWKAGAKLLDRHASLPRDNRASRFALDANREPIQWPDLSGVPEATQSAVTSNSHGRLEKVRELVSADPRLVFSISTDDELAIEASAHLGARPIIRYHLDNGAPLSLPTAVSLGDHDSVEFWLERDPTLANERGAHDFPVMWYAVLGGGSVEMAELLAHFEVPVDQESMGTTALHWCVKRRDSDLARWLIEHGADPEAVGYKWSREGQTPLEIAFAENETRMAGLLKSLGARR